MREIRVIDPFTAGEKPRIDLQFYETEQNLSGFEIDVRVSRDGIELDLAGDIEWTDATKGQARVQFGEGDIDVSEGREYSEYRMEAWAGNESARIATLLIVWLVYQHVGAESPSI